MANNDRGTPAVVDKAAFIRAIYGQESNSGQDPNANKVNSSGAFGPMQVIEPTFNGLKRLGLIPAEYDFKNPAHAKVAGEAEAGRLFDLYQGNAAHAAAAYYGGEKAVRNGEIVDFGDKKNPKAPTTRQYAEQVIGRMGAKMAPASPTAAAQRDAVQNQVPTQPAPNQGVQALLQNTEDLNLKEASRPNMLEKIGAAMQGNSDMALLRGVMRPEFDDQVDPNFKVDPKSLVGLSRDQMQQRLEARSQPELDSILQRESDEQDRVKAVTDGGTASGLALSFGAEIASVTNWVAPFAAAKALGRVGLGSEALARQGRAGAAVASGIAESVAGGTAIEGAIQYTNDRFDPANLFVAATVDTVFGGGIAHMATRHAASQRAVSDLLRREESLIQQAHERVGPGATQAQVEAEYQAMRHQEIKSPIDGALSPVRQDRKLMDNPDTVGIAEDTQGVSNITHQDTPYSSAGIFDTQYRGNVRDNGYAILENVGVIERKAGMTPAMRKDMVDSIVDTPGVHLSQSLRGNQEFTMLADSLEKLRKQLLPEVALHLTDGAEHLKVNTTTGGLYYAIKPNTSVIALRSGSMARQTMVHELGHAVIAHRLSGASTEVQNSLLQALDDWSKTYTKKGFAQDAALQRSPISKTQRHTGTQVAKAQQGEFEIGSLDDLVKAAFPTEEAGAKYAKYFSNFDEFGAEQFAKFVEAQALGVGKQTLSVPQQLVTAIKEMVKDFLHLFGYAKEEGLLKADYRFEQFFNDVLAGNKADGKQSIDDSMAMMALDEVPPAKPADSVNAVMQDFDAVRFGISALPMGTAAERADAKAMLNLYKKANAWDLKNPIDAAYHARVQNLTDNSVFNVASTGLLMLKSKNPLVRMVASELLEDASGAAGKRNSTASISKYLHERLFMGNVINDVQDAYSIWRKDAGGSIKDDFLGGEYRARFDKEVALAIETRKRVGPQKASEHPSVAAAADALEAAYERIRRSQIENQTLGWAGMPSTSVGYMPHKMSSSKVRNLSNGERQVLHDALQDQFVTIEGWDMSFADQLAAKYLDRVQARAVGGYDSPMGGASSGSAEIVNDAMLAMGMSTEEVRKNMQKFNRGAAGFTKGRIDLDLTQVFHVDGKDFRLIDIFDTDQLGLVRAQAGRASGEVALARHGVYGQPGLTLLRKAMSLGEDGRKADLKEFEAFDQIAAEFMNAPFGNAGGKFMERARTLNSVVRLGGIVFNQFAEFINGVTHVGVVRTLDAVTSIPRLRSEIIALSKGKPVNNPLLTSLELVGGGEFGTDAYKIVMPFDSPDHAYPTYGRDTITAADRLLRGASHAQAKLSMWRMIHSSQQRGMAEQIVSKMAKYVRDGKDDVALTQFGIGPDLQARLKLELNDVAKFDSNGNLLEFDATKFSNKQTAEEVIHAVHRGVSQIIQGTFIGETGKWAHDGWLKLLTQFRTFSITSMEKQWARQRNSRGTAEALGIMLGSMSVAAPVYMARVYANSIGREDRDEYIAKHLDPMMIARQTLNYIAMSGMASDFIDAGAALAPDELGLGAMTGGRAGVSTDFVGNLVMPAASIVNDVWKAAQELDNPEKAARVLPGSRLPFLLPAINALGN